MTDEPSRAVLERLRSVHWDDWDEAFDHPHSRALLMREYMRRAALWAQAYGAEDVWPFFDIAEYVDPTVQLDADVAAELEQFLSSGIGRNSVKRTCQGAVRWAALRSTAKVDLPDLPDPYEPLLLMYERGGGFSIGEFIDLNGVSLPFWSLEASVTATPFLTLARTTLDALDGEGAITYYAKISEGYPRGNPRGVVRRRLVGRDEEVFDEAFTRNLRWEPTEYLRLYELGHNEIDHVEISATEAAAFIEAATERLSAGQ
ncbi:hypothetical protein [Streptomyces sp. NPDC002851]